MRKLVYAMLILALLFPPVKGAEKEKPAASPAETAVNKIARDYEAAFNKGDAKALGAMFAGDVEYTNEDGDVIQGRDALVAQLKKDFALNPGAKMVIQVNSVRNLSPDVAIERGLTTTTSRDGQQESAGYTAIHTLKDGKWQIQQLMDTPVPNPPPGQVLASLGWMVGTWTEKDGDAEIETRVNWAQGNNFLTRNFKVSVGENVTLQGWQIIGWDASEKKIRSWLFDTEGAFQEGTWTSMGNAWSIKQEGVLPDGATISSENILKRVGDDQCTWESTNRTLDGDPQPNLPRVMMIRAKSK